MESLYLRIPTSVNELDIVSKYSGTWIFCKTVLCYLKLCYVPGLTIKLLKQLLLFVMNSRWYKVLLLYFQAID